MKGDTIVLSYACMFGLTVNSEKSPKSPWHRDFIEATKCSFFRTHGQSKHKCGL